MLMDKKIFLKNNDSRDALIKLLVIGFIVVLLIDLVIVFLPFLKLNEPSWRKTSPLTGEVTYGGWHITRFSMITLVFPAILVAVPYLVTLVMWCRYLKPRVIFEKFLEKMSNKKRGFAWLKITAFLNLGFIILFTAISKSGVSQYAEYGAYARLTFLGWLNVLFTLTLIAFTLVFSYYSKQIVAEKALIEEEKSDNTKIDEVGE